MTRYIAAAGALFSLLLLAGTANAQDDDITAPTITFDAPANGVDLSDVTDDPDLFSRGRVTVSGTASDDTRVVRVEYRIERSRRWRKATLIRTSADENAQNYAWAVRVRMNRKVARRIYVRAYDPAGNESDILGRRLKRGKR